MSPPEGYEGSTDREGLGILALAGAAAAATLAWTLLRPRQGGCPPEASYRCPDGSCVASADQCPASGCQPPTPYTCPDGSCAASAAECPQTGCQEPTPYTCWDGACAASPADCPCPPGAPYRCPDGGCALDASYCNCPPATPVRCWDGSCVASQANCPCPPATPYRCPDGSCAASAAACPCPPATPYRCPDGSCVASAAACPCPPATPYRCPDGSCKDVEFNCAPDWYQPTPPVRLAFYYLWYPDGWCGATHCSRYHPVLGDYASADDAVIDQHIYWMQEYHLDGAVLSWWGPNDRSDVAAKHLMDRALRLDSPFRRSRFALYFEPEMYDHPTVDQLVTYLQYIDAYYLWRPNYLRYNGAPVLFVYSDQDRTVEASYRWGEAKARFGKPLYLNISTGDGFPLAGVDPRVDAWHVYIDVSDGYAYRAPWSTMVVPGFWRFDEATPRLARDTNRWRTQVAQAKATNAPWQLFTSWNEWFEGSALEPAYEYWGEYLGAIRDTYPART